MGMRTFQVATLSVLAWTGATKKSASLSLRSAILPAMGCCAVFLLSGCAVHYYDQATGTEHLWGFGHLKMAVQPSSEGVRAVVNGTQSLGLGVGLGQQDYYLSAGWNDQRILRVADDTSVRLEWPTADFFNVRVGTNPPFLTPTNLYLGRTNQ